MKKAAEINHPVFGKLLRTDRNELLTFRELPHLQQFVWWGPADGKPLIEYLNKSQRELVESWRTPSLELAGMCRDGQIHSSLRSLGVFEMSIDVSNDSVPTPSQETAYRQFLDHEQKVCATVVDALMRYYLFLRQVTPDAFDYLDADRRPDNPSVAEFGRICRLDRMTVCRGVANGMSPLRLSWDPVWDPEHGLGTIVFQGQVIMIGDTFEFLASPKAFMEQDGEFGWGTKQMTDNEKGALATFVENYEPVLEEDDSDTDGDSATWQIEVSAAAQQWQAKEQAADEREARDRKQDFANRMQAARDKALHLGIAGADDDVDKVLYNMSFEQFRLHFGEFGLSRAFFKGAG